MSIICPTVTAFSLDEYKEQLERLIPFALRIHIDLMDGDFAPTLSPSVSEVWWPKNIQADLHIMYQRPMDVLDDVMAHHPHLTVVHAEAEHANSFVHELHEARMKVGIALLPETPVEVIHQFINVIDHVLIFSGNLGHHGGTANLLLMSKVAAVRAMRPDIEIGWDGGVNDKVVRILAEAGVDVLNTGGYIQKADNPAEVYQTLLQLLQS